MISAEKAKALILKNTKPLPSSEIKVIDSLGCVLSENIISPVNIPLFNQSAMDGYAIVFNDFIKNRKIKIIGEVAAGKVFNKKIKPGQAVRIFTGAAVPAGADAVVMQEKVNREGEYITINDTALKSGSNIRKAGSDIKKGKIALKRGTTITAGGIGYMAAMGLTKVSVVSKPNISVIVTGSELIKPGKSLKPGQIYESNSFALETALHSLYLESSNNFSVPDDEAIVTACIKKSIVDSDIVLITGGISVGDYDFAGKALKKLQVKNIFYKIKQKPGKPLFFGKKGKTFIFGLPGNPAAVLTCFYEYVFPAIRIMHGYRDVFLKKTFLPVAKAYSKKKGLSFFLKGKISDGKVTPLEGQESFVLSSFALADCLIYLPEEKENVSEGELAEVHLLPGLY